MKSYVKGFVLIELFIVLFIVVIVGILGYVVLDSSFLTYKTGKGIVVSKSFDPAHESTHTESQMIGKIASIRTVTDKFPDRYFIDVVVNDKISQVGINKELFNNIDISDQLYVSYANHRYSDKVEIGYVLK